MLWYCLAGKEATKQISSHSQYHQVTTELDILQQTIFSLSCNFVLLYSHIFSYIAFLVVYICKKSEFVVWKRNADVKAAAEVNFSSFYDDSSGEDWKLKCHCQSLTTLVAFRCISLWINWAQVCCWGKIDKFQVRLRQVVFNQGFLWCLWCGFSMTYSGSG